MAALTTSSAIELRQFIISKLPSVNIEGCHFTPVQGLAAQSFRIEGENVCLLARQQTLQQHALGVSRWREGQVLKRCGQGIGPHVVLLHSEWLIVEWINANSVDDALFTVLNTEGALARLTAQLHQRRRSGYPLDLRRRFANYWQHIDRHRLTPAWLAWQQYFMQSKMPSPLMLAPLHMDIHAGNLLMQEGQLRLIDWEYGVDGDVALELAVLFRFNQFSVRDQQHFLSHYIQHSYSDLTQLTLQVQRWLPWVDYLVFMWFEVRWQQSQDPTFLRMSEKLYQRFCL